jgi:serine/threonine-protein kinase
MEWRRVASVAAIGGVLAGACESGSAILATGCLATCNGSETGHINDSSPGPFFPGGWMYERIDDAPAHPESDAITEWLENNGGWGTGEIRVDFSIQVLEADANTPRVSFERTGAFYEPDCDHVKVPLPKGGALEGEEGYPCKSDGDCHLIVRDSSTMRLFEMWRANMTDDGLEGGCLAAWDMTRIYGELGRGDQCTSADAAGFPIAPLLFSADEIAAGEIAHAIRFILPNDRMREGLYTRPATHAGAPSGPSPAPVYGSRWRLRADYDVDSLPSRGAQVVARALQRYGMALADGGNIALTAQSDRNTRAKWDDHLDTHDLAALRPTDFEVIDTGPDITLTYDCVRTEY